MMSFVNWIAIGVGVLVGLILGVTIALSILTAEFWRVMK